MKRISILLAVCLLLSIPAQAAAPAVFQYQSSQLGFSITVPGICQGEVIAEETDTGVNFYHAPSREKYGGEIGSVVVVSPRSDFFSGHYREDLIATGKYNPMPTHTNTIRYIDKPVSNLRVSAGTGSFLDEDNFEMVSFPENAVPAEADFGVRVSGNSMEPV